MFDCAKILLQNGGNIETIYGNGDTILMNAVKQHRISKCKEVIKWLLENGANGNARNKKVGYTAMELAIDMDFDDIASLMICYGVSLKKPNSIGYDSVERTLVAKKTKVFKAILVSQQMF